jgi:hypothetical protein
MIRNPKSLKLHEKKSVQASEIGKSKSMKANEKKFVPAPEIGEIMTTGSRIRLRVQWLDGTTAREANAITVVANKTGCMAVMGAALPLHKKVQVINPNNGRKTEAQIVWRDRVAWDAALKFATPDAGFWGSSFATLHKSVDRV